MDAIRNMMTRQSVRSFTQEAISKEDLQTIIDCALASPTGKNLQNRLFTVLTKKEDIEKLNDLFLLIDLLDKQEVE